MIRLGICAAIEKIQIVADAGFDYLEAGLGAISEMTADAFAANLAIARGASIGVEAFNGMVPASVRLTGPSVDPAAVRAYLDTAFARAEALGGKVIVFGSGRARQVPDDFPTDEAYDQLVEYLRQCAVYCKQTGLRIAIEPLRKAECNIINLVSEGAALAKRVDRPEIGTLGDTYHMAAAQEPLSALTDAGALLYHVHTSHPETRFGPKAGDGYDYAPIFDALRKGDYAGRVSVEGRLDPFEDAVREAFDVLSQLRG